MVESITLYYSANSPISLRVELALHEVGFPYKKFPIDLKNKPKWFIEKVNPAGKIPAITYGGPDVPPDVPSPSSFKLAESLVILEFIADLFPNSTLMPKDAIARAKIRFFVEGVNTKIIPATMAFFARGESPDALYRAYDDIQELIATDGVKFAVGNEFTIADAALLPLIAIAELTLSNGIGGYAEGEGRKVLEVFQGPRYSKLWAYFQDLKTRKSFQDSFDERAALDVFTKQFAK